MRTLAFFLLYCATITLQAQKSLQVAILPGSSLIIKGSSNVNSFDCELKNELDGRVIEFDYTNSASQFQVKNARFSVEVKNFDCGSKLITRDMHQTLKQPEVPKMHFELLSLDTLRSEIWMNMTIAGTTKKYKLYYDQKLEPSKGLCVSICNDFSMMDFGIKAPTTMMGMIKVSDYITINVDLILDFNDRVAKN